MGTYSCTAVRIPTARAHSESIVALFDKPVDIAAARKALEEAPGVKLVDDTENMKYPMPMTATGQYDVEVGRLRKNIAFDDALEFFRWSKDSHKEEEMLWKMRSRFDIGCILPDTKSSRRAGRKYSVFVYSWYTSLIL